MQAKKTIGGTVAQFEAWYAADPDGDAPEPSAAAAALADLFARAERGGADLHDPSPELLRWLTRDLSRDDAVDGDAYELAVRTLVRYLLFLRAHDLWRRSERAVQECWRVFDWATQEPLGLSSLGAVVDEAIAAVLADVPARGDVVAAAFELGFVVPLQRTLDDLAQRSVLTRGEVADVVGIPAGTVALDLWVDGLEEAGLVRIDETGYLTPRSEVVEAGGAPPLTADLVGTVVMGLVRAALFGSFAADLDAGLMTVPRGTATLLALIASCDEEFFVAADADDDEETTAGVVELFVRKMSGGDAAQVAGRVAEVVAVVEALGELGVVERTVLERGGVAYLAAPQLRHAIMRAVVDYTGQTGSPDDVVAWDPVDRWSPHPAGTGIELSLTLEGVGEEEVTRRVRVVAVAPLHLLHRVIQSGFDWLNRRVHVFLDPGGTPRYVHPTLLRRFEAAEDAAVTDSQAVQVGAVLGRVGDELVYAYGGSGAARVRVRVEAVVEEMAEAIASLGGEGRAPGEPSILSEVLGPRLPAGMVLPAGLEAAWRFMESQGWRGTSRGHHQLVPGVGDAAPGIVFDTGAPLDGLVPEPAQGRLLPIGQTDGTGSVAALWLDDDGQTRVVGLGSEGQAYVLAESGFELVRLLAVGYDELTDTSLGLPPDPASRAGVERFRTWVVEEVGLDVPTEWPAVGRDRFTAWVERARAGAAGVVGAEGVAGDDGRAVPESTTTVTGEITTVLEALGRPDGEGLAALAGLVGVDLAAGGLRRSGAALRHVGVEVAFADGALTTVFLVTTGEDVYPRPDALIDGVPTSSTRDDVVAALGEPEASGARWLRYVVGGRYLHLQLGEAGIDRVTVMVEAP